MRTRLYKVTATNIDGQITNLDLWSETGADLVELAASLGLTLQRADPVDFQDEKDMFGQLLRLLSQIRTKMAEHGPYKDGREAMKDRVDSLHVTISLANTYQLVSPLQHLALYEEWRGLLDLFNQQYPEPVYFSVKTGRELVSAVKSGHTVSEEQLQKALSAFDQLAAYGKSR